MTFDMCYTPEQAVKQFHTIRSGTSFNKGTICGLCFDSHRSEARIRSHTYPQCLLRKFGSISQEHFLDGRMISFKSFVAEYYSLCAGCEWYLSDHEGLLPDVFFPFLDNSELFDNQFSFESMGPTQSLTWSREIHSILASVLYRNILDISCNDARMSSFNLADAATDTFLYECRETVLCLPRLSVNASVISSSPRVREVPSGVSIALVCPKKQTVLCHFTTHFRLLNSNTGECYMVGCLQFRFLYCIFVPTANTDNFCNYSGIHLYTLDSLHSSTIPIQLWDKVETLFPPCWDYIGTVINSHPPVHNKKKIKEIKETKYEWDFYVGNVICIPGNDWKFANNPLTLVSRQEHHHFFSSNVMKCDDDEGRYWFFVNSKYNSMTFVTAVPTLNAPGFFLVMEWKLKGTNLRLTQSSRTAFQNRNFYEPGKDRIQGTENFAHSILRAHTYSLSDKFVEIDCLVYLFGYYHFLSLNPSSNRAAHMSLGKGGKLIFQYCEYCNESFGKYDDNSIYEIYTYVGKEKYHVEMCGDCFRGEVSDGVFLPLVYDKNSKKLVDGDKNEYDEYEDVQLVKLLKPFDMIKTVYETIKPEKEE